MQGKEVGRFVLVGLAVASGYFATGAVLHHGFRLGLGPANLIAIMLMHPLSYLGHRYFTFRYAGAWGESIRRFSVLAVFSTVVAASLSFTQERWHVPVVLALLVNCVLVPPVTLVVLKLWVFAAGTRETWNAG